MRGLSIPNIGMIPHNLTPSSAICHFLAVYVTRFTNPLCLSYTQFDSNNGLIKLTLFIAYD